MCIAGSEACLRWCRQQQQHEQERRSLVLASPSHVEPGVVVGTAVSRETRRIVFCCFAGGGAAICLGAVDIGSTLLSCSEASSGGWAFFSCVLVFVCFDALCSQTDATFTCSAVDYLRVYFPCVKGFSLRVYRPVELVTREQALIVQGNGWWKKSTRWGAGWVLSPFFCV